MTCEGRKVGRSQERRNRNCQFVGDGDGTLEGEITEKGSFVPSPERTVTKSMTTPAIDRIPMSY